MSNGDFLWKLISVLSAVSALVATIVSIAVVFRRQPPLSEEMYRGFASKDDLQKLDDRHTRTAAEIFRQIREIKDQSLSAISDTISRGFRDQERALGRVEGKLDAHLGDDNR